MALYLSDNQLTGPIPPDLDDLEKLVRLDLSNNQLTGEIPPELGNLKNLQMLFLAANDGLAGCMPFVLTETLLDVSGPSFCEP